MGSDALYYNTVDGNTAVGAFTLSANTTGTQNTAVGHLSLNDNIDGSYNVGIGRSSLINNTSGNYNISIGYSSGTTNLTGSNNTFIGRFADAGASNLSNATAVGANATVSTSNSLILGDNANVGIGTSSPSSKLDVVGNVQADDYDYATPKVYHYSLGGSSFKPLHSTNNPWAAVWGNAQAYLTDETGYMGADVHLPDGAVITGIEINFEDDAAENLTINLDAYNLQTFVSNIHSYTTTQNGAGVLTYTNVALNHTVDNSNWAYYVKLYANPWSSQGAGNNLNVRSVVITYQMTSTH